MSGGGRVSENLFSWKIEITGEEWILGNSLGKHAMYFNNIIFTESLPCAPPVLGDAREMLVIETAHPPPSPVLTGFTIPLGERDRAVPRQGSPEGAGLGWGNPRG